MKDLNSSIKFNKISPFKYVSSSKLALMKNSEGWFSVCLGSKVTKWGSHFISVKAAEDFLNLHDLTELSCDTVPMNEDDAKFIFDMYGRDVKKIFPYDDLLNEWNVTDRYSISGSRLTSNKVSIQLYKDGKLIEHFFSAEPLIDRLDEITSSQSICSSKEISEALSKIYAAKNNNKSSFNFSKDLIRVKRSSNVWAYGVQVSNENRKVGNIYVQFKGKNGGPGDVYVYYDVPVQLWRRFLSAPSCGHFVYKYLRNNFLYSKLTGDKRGKLKNAVNHKV